MNSRRLLWMLAAIWMLAMVIGYAALHLPWVDAASIVLLPVSERPAVGPALASVLLQAAAVVLLVLVGGGTGFLIVRGLEWLSGLETAAIQWVIGLGGVSALITIAGLTVGFPSSLLGWLLTLAAAAALNQPIRRWAVQLVEGLRLATRPPYEPFFRWVRVGVLALPLLALTMTLVPPTAWDALTYHIEAPRYYLEAGRIVANHPNHFLGFPQYTQMLFGWLMLLGGDSAPALLHWAAGVSIGLLVVGFAHRLDHANAGWIACGILLASESFWLEMTIPYNDLFLGACVLGAVIIVLGASDGRQVAWAGVLTGLAVATKYTAAGFAVAMALLTVWIFRRRRPLHTVTLLTAAALLAFAPWAIKNILLDGNPFSPLLFGTPGFSDLDAWYYLRPGTGEPLWLLVLLPIRLTVFASEGSAYQVAVGALVFTLLPLAALLWSRWSERDQHLIRALLVFSVPAYLYWLVGAGVSWFLTQPRLLFPLFPILALIGGLVVETAGTAARLPAGERLVRPLVAVVLLWAAADSAVTWLAINPLPVTVGLEREDDYLLRRMGVHYAAMQTVRDLPDGAVTLTLWEPRVYYCGNGCTPDSMINQWWHDRERFGDPAAIAAQWRAEGITHILVHEAGLVFLLEEEPFDPLDAADIAALDQLREQHMTLIWDAFGFAYRLYELDPAR
ncbi:MAG: hypothetical protein ACFB51_21550 [Anaerolineae bacterium]